MKHYISLIILFLILGITTVNAQKRRENNVSNDAYKHQLSASLGIGMSTLSYSVNNGSRSSGFGGNLGLGYSYYFSNHWGVGLGFELTQYNAKAELDSFSDIIVGLKDQHGSSFEFRSTVTNYTEKQSALLVNVPIMGQYFTPIANSTTFQISAGIKLGIPISGKYKSSGATFKNSGYYPEYENELTTQEFMGFGNFTNRDIEKDASYEIGIGLALEAGLRFDLSDKLGLYTGIYFDYGLNDIVKDSDMHFMDYKVDNASEFSNNGILESGYGSKIQDFTDKVIPMAFGIKLRFSVGL